MNDTINKIKDHRSIRKFKNQIISDEIINELINVGQMSPSSINGQQTSIIAIKNKDTLQKLVEITGGQTWIAECSVFFVFVMDFYKAKLACEKNERELIITNNVESIIVGSVDAGITMQNVTIAAESLGLGTVCIGGIRGNTKEMIKILNLPEYTFPLVGLCIGYPEDNSKLKPRMDKKAYFHNEVYDKSQAKKAIDDYDVVMKDYLISINREEEGNWSKNTSNAYQKVYYPNVCKDLEQQGFKNTI